MKYSAISLLTISIMLISPVCVSAQEAPDAALDVNIRFYKWSFINSVVMPNISTGEMAAQRAKKAPNEFWIISDGKWERVNISERTKSISYKGVKDFKIYRRTGDGESSSDFQEIARLTLPEKTREVFILIFQRSDSLKFYPMDISPDALPKGKFVLMNITSTPVAVRWGTEQKMLPSLSHVILTPNAKDEREALPLQIAAYVASKWELVYKSRMRTYTDEHNVMLLYDPYGKKTPNFNIQTLNF